MRVRTWRFRSGGQVAPTARCSPKTTPQASHASHRSGAYQQPHPFGCHRLRYPLRGRMPADRFSPSPTPSLPVSSFTRAIRPPARCSGTMASADFPGHFLPGISPDKNVLLPGTTATFTSTTGPATSLCCAPSSHRDRPCMRFLFVGPPVSASLPSPARLPSRSWLHVVVLSRFHVPVLLQGTSTPCRMTWAPHLQHAHAGRTQTSRPVPK